MKDLNEKEIGKHLRMLDTYGYALVRDVLSPSEVAELKTLTLKELVLRCFEWNEIVRSQSGVCPHPSPPLPLN